LATSAGEDLMTDAILTLSSAVGLASLIFYLLTVDRLVRSLHEDYREEWNRIGQPVGLFYIPRTTSWWNGIVTLHALICDILIKTPSWLSGKPDLLFLVKRVRWSIVVLVISMVVGLALR
jgi:hypothetical protein